VPASGHIGKLLQATNQSPKEALPRAAASIGEE
jgi:hypothetical protein